MSEKSLHRAICDYIRYNYKNILFNSDLSGSMKLSMHQAVHLKNLRSNRGYPDLMIFEPRSIYNGLFIELKKDREKLYTKDGRPATPHIAEQLNCLKMLQERGYLAEFAVGFDQAKKLIDDYLKLSNRNK